MIKGKTVGVLGLGHIGKKVAALASAFGANVIYYDIVRQPEQEEQFGYRFVDFDTLLKESDIFTIHCPLNEETRGMIGAAQFAKMKPTAMLINTARGPIVDEAALVDALTTGKIATAGLDTYEHEPLPKDHPLLTLDNVVASAHAGGNTKDNDINMEVAEFQLTSQGAAVDKAWNGREAVERFAASAPGGYQAILMDVMMPVMNGFEASRAIRALDRPDAATVPILAMTAQASDECAQSCHQVGMNGRLVKPLDAKKLAKSIREAVQNKQ